LLTEGWDAAAESAVGDRRTPIYFVVNNAGWMAGYLRGSVTGGAVYDSTTSVVGSALKAGYVFVDVANRSRGLVGADGSAPGKAPDLARIGAAGITADGRSRIRDDVFAINAYCPITDLGHADQAIRMALHRPRHPQRRRAERGAGGRRCDRRAVPRVRKGLGLRNPDGSRLIAGNLIPMIKREVIRSAAPSSSPVAGRPGRRRPRSRM
jgi:hypothetical protein